MHTHGYRVSENIAKALGELVGLCRGVVCDRRLNDREIAELANWLEYNQTINETWPIIDLRRRIEDILADGIVDESERELLVRFLDAFVGDAPSTDGAASTTLPIERVERIEFADREFCFTGVFAYGNRDRCEQAVVTRGGRVNDDVRKKTLDYLVIGVLASPDWISTSYGRKIQRAVEYRDRGAKLAIVSEEDWRTFL